MSIYATITLINPIKDGNGKEITQLEVRRGKAKDLQEMRKFPTDAEQEAYLFSRLTGLTVDDIGELDIADYLVLQRHFTDMTKGKSPQVS